MAEAQKFGDWLKERIEERSRSVNAWANYDPPISRGTVYSWIKGERRPMPDQCILIAQKLGIDVDEVYARAGRVPSTPQEPSELPGWASLLPSLTEDDRDYIGRLVRSLAIDPLRQRESPEPPQEEPEEPSS